MQDHSVHRFDENNQTAEPLNSIAKQTT